MTIALNILRTEEKVLCPAYISKIYSNCEIQIALLMILNEEKGWHYLAVKKIICIITWNDFKTKVPFIARIVVFLLEQKINLNLMKKYVNLKISVEL